MTIQFVFDAVEPAIWQRKPLGNNLRLRAPFGYIPTAEVVFYANLNSRDIVA